MNISEVSLVDKAANKRKFLIIKRSAEGGDEELEISKALEEIAKAGKSISTANLSRMKEIHGQLGGMIGEHDTPASGKPSDPAPDVTCPKCNKKDCTCADAGQVQKKLEDEKMDVEIKKQLDEQATLIKSQQDQMAILQKSLDDASAIAKAESAKRVTAEYIAKAAKFNALAVSAEVLGPVLKSLAEKDPAGYVVLENVLKASNEAIIKGGLFKELGSGSDTTGDALAKLDAKGAEIQKSDSTLSKEQAFLKACKACPEIYAQYRSGK